jgi:lipopolysaccharide transport system permease protein
MMVFEFGAFGVFVVAFRFMPPITTLLLPLLLIDLFFLSLGISLLLSIFNVYFRDIKFIWQILLQLGFFLSPIFYNLNIFPDNIKFILELNPIVPILDMAHGLVLSGSLPTIKATLYVIGITAFFFAAGLAVFKIKGKTLVEEL